MSQQYPSAAELRRIRNWDMFTDSPIQFMEFIHSLWAFDAWGWTQRRNRYWLSTGGWSGNEDIIEAMRNNFMFWSSCWESSQKGGHYRFRLPRDFLAAMKAAKPLAADKAKGRKSGE